MGWGEWRRGEEGERSREEKRGKRRERWGKRKGRRGEGKEYGEVRRGILVDALNCLLVAIHDYYTHTHTHSLVKSITSDEEFEQELRQTGEILVVVDFKADW